ncbi:hypothetical protein H0G86_001211 [Trichoderma simmonsii]|uniref:Uncharacterized protein n=1 Tax=Trichoderma simmonsii TaxID=1491479 RepID=A0A8G0L6B8_9HYPO|nr:hypothetical protein H0G86_001211 [Trichoderma simmonsii]
MESSPLTKAHDHARAAAVATRQSSDTTVAISEHTLAAGEFANAANLTSSVEALRTLKLLEEHHRKLAEILKLPPEQVPHARDDGEKTASEKDGDGLGTDASDALQAAVTKAQPPGLSQRRYMPREMSSSIASNLASARGIRSKDRSQPLSPSVSNDQAPGNVDPQAKRDASKAKMQNIMERQTGRPTWVPPITPVSKQQEGAANGSASPKVEQGPPRDDGGYARFYNTFGSLINKISAPLAFAGLPLIQEEPATPTESSVMPSSSVNLSPSKQPRARASPSPSADPDLSKIYSKATMRALVRDGHTAADSFYVVPSTGHTMSYANILSYAEKEKRRLEASTHGDFLPQDEDDDDFVDAREAPGSSVSARRRITRTHSEKELYNTIEELSLENKSLKDMLDKLSKRLHTFEASAQSSALALAESYRIMPGGSPLPGGSGRANDDELIRKNNELEEQLAEMTKHMERLEKDNRKMQKTLEKYREKWETLKAGAKARREAQVTAESIEDARSSQV